MAVCFALSCGSAPHHVATAVHFARGMAWTIALAAYSGKTCSWSLASCFCLPCLNTSFAALSISCHQTHAHSALQVHVLFKHCRHPKLSCCLQLSRLFLNGNQLTGGLPDTWGSLQSVCLHVSLAPSQLLCSQRKCTVCMR